MELARKVCQAAEQPSDVHLLYPDDAPIKDKVETVAKEIYGANGVTYTQKALRSMREIELLGGSHLPVCIAKTQYSLSDDPKKLGRPTDFRITIREMKLSSGAGFVVAYAGNILTMPGLPSHPASEQIDVDENGKISGLF